MYGYENYDHTKECAHSGERFIAMHIYFIMYVLVTSRENSEYLHNVIPNHSYRRHYFIMTIFILPANFAALIRQKYVPAATRIHALLYCIRLINVKDCACVIRKCGEYDGHKKHVLESFHTHSPR